jgi:hypothetical protein
MNRVLPACTFQLDLSKKRAFSVPEGVFQALVITMNSFELKKMRQSKAPNRRGMPVGYFSTSEENIDL